jgi:predicted MFS family arabinose efflux permease
MSFGSFLAFYLADLGWSKQNVGLALTVGGLAAVAAQIPGGALADAVRWKRGLAACGFVLIAAALILALWPGFSLVFVAEPAAGGRLAFVEVGALVGRIVQVHPADAPFQRGEEKSCFRFGGSAIVMFGEPGKWRPFDALLEHTKQGVETLARVGEPICLGTSREM